MQIEHVAAPTDDVRALIGELDAELNAEYAPDQRHGLSLAGVFQPSVLFFIARLDGAAVGCGGIALEDGFAEVKRMYVRPHARGSGVADAILDRLEREAAERGITRVVLETGDAQGAATRFYQRAQDPRVLARQSRQEARPHPGNVNRGCRGSAGENPRVGCRFPALSPRQAAASAIQ